MRQEEATNVWGTEATGGEGGSLRLCRRLGDTAPLALGKDGWHCHAWNALRVLAHVCGVFARTSHRSRSSPHPVPRGQESGVNKYVSFLAAQLKPSQRPLCIGGERAWVPAGGSGSCQLTRGKLDLTKESRLHLVLRQASEQSCQRIMPTAL